MIGGNAALPFFTHIYEVKSGFGRPKNLVTKRNEFKFGLGIFQLLPPNETDRTFVRMDLLPFDWHMTPCRLLRKFFCRAI